MKSTVLAESNEANMGGVFLYTLHRIEAKQQLHHNFYVGYTGGDTGGGGQVGGRPDNVDLCVERAKREKMKQSGEGSKHDKRERR